MTSKKLHLVSTPPKLPLPELPDALKQQARSADSAFRSWLHTHFPGGLVLKWKTGKYEGRLCRVKHAIIINEPDGEMTVGLRVETRRYNGDGYVNGNDDFHRIYHDAHYFFEREE